MKWYDFDFLCKKISGGKQPMWLAANEKYKCKGSDCPIVGSGNTADNAIKDCKKQIRRYLMRK